MVINDAYLQHQINFKIRKIEWFCWTNHDLKVEDWFRENGQGILKIEVPISNIVGQLTMRTNVSSAKASFSHLPTALMFKLTAGGRP